MLFKARLQTALLALPVVAALAACSSDGDNGNEIVLRDSTSAEGRGTFSDAPGATFVGTEILTQGGTGVDAAIAMFFTMTVTLPSAAGLGGGGSCIVSSPVSGGTEIVDFPLRPVSDMQGAAAVPAALRGLLLMHARHGRFPFAALIEPAEKLARQGVVVSKTLAGDLAAAGRGLLEDPVARRVYLRGDGSLLQAGNQLVMPDYAQYLRWVRGNLSGAAKPQLIFSDLNRRVAALESSANPDRMAAYSASLRPATEIEVQGYGFTNNILTVTATDEREAATVAAMWQTMSATGLYSDTDGPERPHLLTDAFAAAHNFISRNGPVLPTAAEARQAMKDYQAGARRFRNAPLGRLSGANWRPGAAVFGVIDRTSQNVVCAISMGAPFGMGRIMPESGVLAGAAPPRAGDPGWDSRPTAVGALIYNQNSQALFALTGVSGGPGALAVSGQTMLDILDDVDAEETLNAPRTVPGPTTDTIAVEEGHDVTVVDRLNSLGYKITPRGDFSRAHAIVCPAGLRLGEADCTAHTDDRGSGAILGAN